MGSQQVECRPVCSLCGSQSARCEALMAAMLHTRWLVSFSTRVVHGWPLKTPPPAVHVRSKMFKQVFSCGYSSLRQTQAPQPSSEFSELLEAGTQRRFNSQERTNAKRHHATAHSTSTCSVDHEQLQVRSLAVDPHRATPDGKSSPRRELSTSAARLLSSAASQEGRAPATPASHA